MPQHTGAPSVLIAQVWSGPLLMVVNLTSLGASHCLHCSCSIPQQTANPSLVSAQVCLAELLTAEMPVVPWPSVAGCPLSPPANKRSLKTDGACVPPTAADAGEPLVGRGCGLSVLIVSPAGRGPVVPEGAGVEPAAADARELLILGRRGFSVLIVSPAQGDPVRRHPAGVQAAGADT